MTRSKKFAAGTVLAGIVVLGGATAGIAASRHKTDPESERRQEAAYTEAHRVEAAVSEEQATQAALARHSGTVVDAHLQDEGDGLRWEIKPDDGTQVWEVQVDAATGRVVSDQLDD